MADELVFRQWFRRPPSREMGGVPPVARPPRRRPPQFHIDEATASFSSTVGFVSGVVAPAFASTVNFASSFGLPGLFVAAGSTALFRSRFAVSGGNLASPRYRR